jgi:hypothetical protein
MVPAHMAAPQTGTTAALLWRLTRSARSRALEGFMPKVAVVMGIATSLAMIALAIASGRRGGDVERIAPLAAGLLTWGAGVLLCFAASMRAFDRDRDDGWDALLARHGARAPSYLASRIAGLVLVTLEVVVPGTLVAGLCAMLASHEGRAAILALQGMLAGGAYAIAFALVVAPIAMATLGPRGRASGYLFLLSVLLLPALVARWTGQLVPDDWSELVSVPGALDALRDSLMGAIDPLRTVRALAVLVAASTLASIWARAQLHLRRSVARQ